MFKRPNIELIVVIGLAILLNVYHLSSIPHAIHGDVGEMARYAKTLNFPSDLFQTRRWWHVPGMIFLPQYIAFQFGEGLWWARLPDALLGVVFAGLLLLQLRKVVSSNSALLVTLLTVSSSQMIHSWRVGLAFGFPLVLGMLVPFVLWDTLHRQTTRSRILLSGFLLALTGYMYLPGRILLILFPLYVALYLVSSERTKTAREILRTAASVVLVTTLLLVPLIANAFFDPKGAFPRNEYFLFNPASYERAKAIYETESLPIILWEQTWRSFLAPVFVPATWNFDFYGTDFGFFEGLLPLLGIIGIVAVIFRRRDGFSYWIVASYVVGTVMYGVLLVDTPRFNRMLPVFSFWLILAAFGMEAFLKWCSRHSTRRNLVPILSCLVAIQCLFSVYYYFFDLDKRQWWYSDVTRLANYFGQEEEGTVNLLIGEEGGPGFSPNYGTFKILSPRAEVIKWAQAMEKDTDWFRSFKKITLIVSEREAIVLPEAIQTINYRLEKAAIVGSSSGERAWTQKQIASYLVVEIPVNHLLPRQEKSE